MRTRTAAALLLVAATLRPAVAAPELGPALTIRGSRTAVATITVTQEVRYDLHRATVNYAGGRWGGFLIGPDTSRVDAYPRDTLTLRSIYDDHPRAWAGSAFQGRPARSVPGTTASGLLAPGRYRVYLFTDGQDVTVTLPWSAASRTVEPERPFPVRMESAQVLATGLANPSALTLPLDGTAASLTYGAVVWDDGGSATQLSLPDDGACFAYAAKPVGFSSCYRGRQRTGHSVGGRQAGWFEAERMYGSTRGLEWRARISPASTGLVTAVVVRYDP